MIVARRLRWRQNFYYTWKSLLYFFLLSLLVYFLHVVLEIKWLTIPFSAVATLSTALAIYLGFKNNSAYDRWWEARKIWGLLVNYSRAWAREVLTLLLPVEGEAEDELQNFQKKLIYRQAAFVHALRVFLRKKQSYNKNMKEKIQADNTYEDIRGLISEAEYSEFLQKKNPPNFLLQLQSRDLQDALHRGWLSDYRFVRMNKTLTEFNNHQGMSERIKNTPLPRPYSFFSRVFVLVHGTLIPFAFIEELGWINLPLSITINYFFLALDQIGERTEDPFENRMEDTPLTAISITIEKNLKEMLGDESPVKEAKEIDGVIL